MRFLLDTGSAWLWMPGQKCTSCQAANRKYRLTKSLYNGPRSSTFRDNGILDASQRNKRIKYALGDVRGDRVTDEVRLFRTGRKTEGTEFLYANQVGSPFNQMMPEGVLGLGPMARNTGDPIPTIEHMFKKQAFGPEGRAMFSLYFGTKGINNSYIWFGGYSHNWLRTFISDGAKMSVKQIESQISWIDIPTGAKEWKVPLFSWFTQGKGEGD